MSVDPKDRQVAAVRRFNRFYTQKIGVLQDGLLKSPFSLTEVRVLYELAHRERPTAAAIGRDLGLDAGYLSRILTRFGKQGLIAKTPSGEDSRQRDLSLTDAGAGALAPLEEATNRDIEAMLADIGPADRDRLLAAFASVENLLGTTDQAALLLRPPAVGDLGWVVHRQALLYAREYGWDQTFEALLADIVAAYVRDFDAARDCCWIAERNGEIAGSVFVVHDQGETAKLRLLYVEAWARGSGLGRRLVDEAVRFARRAGYKRLTLWTNDILTAARRIYQTAGFSLVREEAHHSFGKDLVGQYWQLDL